MNLANKMKGQGLEELCFEIWLLQFVYYLLCRVSSSVGVKFAKLNYHEGNFLNTWHRVY